MCSQRRARRTHLFTVRLWQEQLDDSHTEFRGEVRHVLSGKRCHFRDWATLQTFLTEQVRVNSSSSTNVLPDDESGATDI